MNRRGFLTFLGMAPAAAPLAALAATAPAPAAALISTEMTARATSDSAMASAISSLSMRIDNLQIGYANISSGPPPAAFVVDAGAVRFVDKPKLA